MSLQYVIDGYNIIHHKKFTSLHKKNQNSSHGLLELIKSQKLTGSIKNKVLIIFDGFPRALAQEEYGGNFNIIYSGRQTADEKIKQLIEKSANPKIIVVVTDDKEIQLFARASRAKVMGIEEFIDSKQTRGAGKEIEQETELTYAQAHKINEELKKIWLKESQKS